MPVYNRTKHTAVKIIAVSVKVLKPILGGNDFYQQRNGATLAPAYSIWDECISIVTMQQLTTHVWIKCRCNYWAI